MSDAGPPPALTKVLERMCRGEEVENELATLVYDDLRRMAQSLLRKERIGHTLQATALTHEAWLRLLDSGAFEGEHAAEVRRRFLCCAATSMRRILVEHARARLRAKRGGGLAHEPLTDAVDHSPDDVDDMLDLDGALDELAKSRPNAARIAELRIYGGYSTAEAAEAADVGLTTAKKEWAVARVLLGRRLGGMAMPSDEGSA